MKLQGIEEMRVDEFKYLASTIQCPVHRKEEVRQCGLNGDECQEGFIRT